MKINIFIIGDVGFLRDICVDTVARNIYNSMEVSVPSESCEKLGKYKTVFDGFLYLKI